MVRTLTHPEEQLGVDENTAFRYRPELIALRQAGINGPAQKQQVLRDSEQNKASGGKKQWKTMQVTRKMS
jgi:hypothetical protein